MRNVITATNGHILTDGKIYGTVIYLAEGIDGTGFYEITEEEYAALTGGEDATEDDYRSALCEMGLSILKKRRLSLPLRRQKTKRGRRFKRFTAR